MNKYIYCSISSDIIIHMRVLSICLLAILHTFSCEAMAGSYEDSLLCMLRDVVKSEYEKLHSDSVPANFVGVKINDENSIKLNSFLGATGKREDKRSCAYSVNVKISTSHSSVYHKLDIPTFRKRAFTSIDNTLQTSISDDIDSVFSELKKRGKGLRKDTIGNDISLEDAIYYSDPLPAKYYSEPLNDGFDAEEWQKMLNEVTHMFRSEKHLLDVSASLESKMVRKYLVTSDGGEIVDNEKRYTLYMTAKILRSNGRTKTLNKRYNVRRLPELPSKEVMMNDVKELLHILNGLYDAPDFESFEGPLLLGSIATGIFMHEMIGHRLESGYRGGIFKPYGTRVFPDFVQITDDPTTVDYRGTSLIGHYKYDDDGIPAQAVTCIKDGMFMSMLTSRTPCFKGSVSNGHGRGEFDCEPVARQANFFVSTSNPVGDSQMREMFIETLKRQNLEYGIYIPEFESGQEGWLDSKHSSIMNPQKPSVPDSLVDFRVDFKYAYKIFADGRPDELVNGTRVYLRRETMCNALTAMGAVCEVYTGLCGARSGFVPVSLIAPKSLFKCAKLLVSADDKDYGIKRLALPAIKDAKYEKERDVIVNALRDEMKIEMDAMQGVCFSYFILNKSTCNEYEYSEGQCIKSYSNKDGGGEVHMFLGNRFSPSNTDGLSGHRFKLPKTYDYSILRHLVRNCAISAYNNKNNRELVSSMPGVQIVRELPATEYTPDYHPTPLSSEELQKIACVLSKEMAKFEEFNHSSVRVSQNQYDDYSVSSEGQVVHKNQVYQTVCGRIDVADKNGESTQKTFCLTVLDGDYKSIVKLFCKKMKEFVKRQRNTLPPIKVVTPITYDGPVLVDGISVKYRIINNHDQDLLDNPFQTRPLAEIGDTIIDTAIRVEQLSDVSSYKGQNLWGYEEVDLDGVKPENVLLVDNGILKNRLSGRMNSRNTSHSTGNERFSGSFATVYPGVLRATSSRPQSLKKIKYEFFRRAKKTGYKYAYILRTYNDDWFQTPFYNGNEILLRVNTETLEEQQLYCTYKFTPQLYSVIATSKEETVTQYRNSTPCSFIHPQAMLYDNCKLSIFEISKNTNGIISVH